MSDESSSPKDQHPASYDDEIIEEEREERRSNVPVVTMVVALAILAITIGVIAYVVSTATNNVPEPFETPSVQPTGEPKLPQQVEEYSLSPGSDSGTEPGSEQLTATAFYVRNGQESMLISAIRPAKDPREQLEDIAATNLVDYDDASVCGRDDKDLDICAVSYGNTLVLVQGLRDQSVDDMVAFARQVAPKIG